LAYNRVLEKRHDIKIRFKVLVDADIPELKESDMEYLDSKLGYKWNIKQGSDSKVGVIMEFVFFYFPYITSNYT